MPSDIKYAILDRFFPPYTARRQIWDNAIRVFLRMFYSSVRSTSLWFTTTGCSGGAAPLRLPEGLSYPLRVFVSQSSAMAQCALPSPVPASSGSARNVRPCDAETGSPRKTRRHGRKRKTRVWDVPVRVPASMTVVQDVHEMEGKIVYDCRPPVLPVSIQLRDFRRPSVARPAASSSLPAPPAGRFRCPDDRLRSGQPTRGSLRSRRMIPGQIWRTNCCMSLRCQR